MEKELTVKDLAQQVKVLRFYAMAMTFVIICFIGVTLVQNTEHFKEITVERINIVEQDGTLRMVLSNRSRQHPGRMDNKDLPNRDRPAGLLFFNDEGDECGGLGYNGDKKDAAMFITMDQYKNDQIMMLSYDQTNGVVNNSRSYGLILNDRDELPLSDQLAYFDSLKTLKDTSAFNAGVKRFKAAGHLAQRMFLGKNKSGEVGLFLTDTKGQPRLRLFVNAQNQPVFQTLDEQGKIINNDLSAR